METLSIDLPTMYGDHHVAEVRRILLAIPGVEDVYASSAFRIARVRIDPAQVTEDVVRSKLEEAGYLGELSVATEEWKSGTPADTVDNPFRHTSAFEQVKTVSFAQTVESSGRALWPCPGLGPIKKIEEEA
jgi:copper chaperone CopZ